MKEEIKKSKAKIAAYLLVLVVAFILGAIFLVGYGNYCYYRGFKEGKAAAVLEIIAND